MCSRVGKCESVDERHRHVAVRLDVMYVAIDCSDQRRDQTIIRPKPFCKVHMSDISPTPTKPRLWKVAIRRVCLGMIETEYEYEVLRDSPYPNFIGENPTYV